MLKLINRADLMGEYKNSITANVIAWSTSISMIILTAAMLWTTYRYS
jgi:Mn2+/Fe2+ NRAMP family transporter